MNTLKHADPNYHPQLTVVMTTDSIEASVIDSHTGCDHAAIEVIANTGGQSDNASNLGYLFLVCS